MPKPYEPIAVWAKACALQTQAGLPLVDIINSSGCFPAKKRMRAAERLKRGHSVSDSLIAFYPDLTPSDVSLLDAGNRVGQLPRGFELLSAQYFLRAQSQSLGLSAFVYPLGLIYIGIFLIGLQSVLYQNVALGSRGNRFHNKSSPLQFASLSA